MKKKNVNGTSGRMADLEFIYLNDTCSWELFTFVR